MSFTCFQPVVHGRHPPPIQLITSHQVLSPSLTLLQQPSAPEVIMTLDTLTVQYLSSQLKTLPLMFARHGQPPFIHSQLYARYLPPAIRDIYTLCPSYTCKTAQNQDLFNRILSQKTHGLISRSPGGPFLDILASVQALTLTLIIRLFDSDIRQRALAEPAHLRTLASWTYQLWRLAPSQMSHTLTPGRHGSSPRVYDERFSSRIYCGGVYSTIKRGTLCTRLWRLCHLTCGHRFGMMPHHPQIHGNLNIAPPQDLMLRWFRIGNTLICGRLEG